MKHFDVIVVGGGHAGVEAALASARKGAQTALVTFRSSDLGTMSCNPAIGGIGKGHIVREIDALDGVMGLAADYAGIQFRLLNRSRGPAVRGPRTQTDRKRYNSFIQQYVASTPKLAVKESEVVDLAQEDSRVCGVVLGDGSVIFAKSVVLTTGTFLNGVVHIGSETRQAGRAGGRSSERLGARLRDFGLSTGRLKTGTPARLRSTSIDWNRVGRQPGDSRPAMLSFLNTAPVCAQIECGVTQTNPHTHDIIRDNLHLSAMLAGNIEGVGPRYCPSVEDKINRFADKESHNVFLEPEGLDSDLVYPNGISTSLPRDVQEAFIKSIAGLENCVIEQFGYAIEYDYMDPRGLRSDLSVRSIDGLFFAGQINGTTGYEEAAGQGLIAGFNAAAAALGCEGFVPSREDSYLGVMVDDLTSKGVTEPYRMFTSRAENRLVLRADNADQRLTERGYALGFVREERFRKFSSKMERHAALIETCRTIEPSRQELQRIGVSPAKNGQKKSWFHVAGSSVIDDEELAALLSTALNCDIMEAESVIAEALYQPYLARIEKELKEVERKKEFRIPEGFDFAKLSSLSNELREKLARHRPETLMHAEKIEGMTPSALTVLAAAMQKTESKSPHAKWRS